MNYDHSPRARHPGMWSQVGLRKHHYEQSQWRWWNSSWTISNPERLCCESAAFKMPAHMENSAVATGLEKVVFIPIPKNGNAKEHLNYHTTMLISHVSKIMLKVLQARFQQYVNWEIPDVQAGFRKGRGSKDQIVNICWIIEKARELKKIYFWSMQRNRGKQQNGKDLEISSRKLEIPREHFMQRWAR